MQEYINIDKCSKFEQIMLLLITNHNDDELRKLDEETGCTCLGEIERNTRFGIDFTKIDWIQNMAIADPDDAEKWKLENQIQDVSMEMIKLYEMIKSYYKE